MKKHKMTTQTKNLGRIGVLMGGVSSEREISLKSGNAVVKALERQGCQVVPLDIDRGSPDKIAEIIQKLDIDSAFIALHGRMGEDGTIQNILEQAHIPYTGSGVEASRLAMNKALTQDLFRKNNIKVPAFIILTKGDDFAFEVLINELGSFPLIVKPAREGSSIGISLVKNEKELDAALSCAWRYDDTLLLEQFIDGRELTVGILDQKALPVIEICPTKKFFDYDAKYIKGLTDYIVPAQISEALSDELHEVALRAHQVLGCSGFSRVDFMMDAAGVHYVLELNTIPGFTTTSLLPKAAEVNGINFDQLCLQLIGLAYGKKKENKDSDTGVC